MVGKLESWGVAPNRCPVVVREFRYPKELNPYSREPKLHQFPDSFVRQGNAPMRPGHSRVTSKSQHSRLYGF